MRLVVSTIPYDRGRSGISVYVREVVKALRDEGHELTILAEPGEEGDVHAPRWTRRAPLSMLWHLFVLPFWLRRHRRDYDGFVICAANRRVCAWYPIPAVATVHDLANFHVPGKYSRSRMFYLAHILPFFAKRAQRLVAVSESTKADMVKYWRCKPGDVTVLYNGLCMQGLNSETAGEGRNILYISRIEHPGKNHVRLIEAYGMLPRTLAEAHPLVIAGSDWKDADAVHRAAVASPHADLIQFTGFVDEDKMSRLWAEAGFYVFPSLFEGFGLSLVEAMARGKPCACSANGSLGEIAGDVAFTFDPEDAGDMADALRRLLEEDASSRRRRVERGLERAKMFSWSDHAKGVVRLLDECVKARASSVARLFGIPVARVTEAEAVEKIVEMVRRPRADKAAFVATLNVDFVSNAVGGWPFGGNDELWGYLKQADFVTADGQPIVLLSKLLREPLPERVTGADMVPAICRRFAEEGLSVYVLGGDQSSLEEAFTKLAPVKVAGFDAAFVKLDEDQSDIIERINAAKPDLLFVALGNPKQELWMGRNAARLDVPVMIGVGGTFNFIAGRVKRAPEWMRKCGLEWIYRISQEPGRLWKRYAFGLVKFSWLSLIHLFGGYRR